MHGTSRNAIEDTKATRLSTVQKAIDSCMVSRWSDETKGVAVSSYQNTVHGVLDGSSSTSGCSKRADTKRGVGMRPKLDTGFCHLGHRSLNHWCEGHDRWLLGRFFSFFVITI
mmetsp:Transcript_109524/g.306277  ORF Transcript_109524/g.306277 Transcript_109524/m.306277 type:complete len:113 (-) Transcript_109524:818-1156(-)